MTVYHSLYFRVLLIIALLLTAFSVKAQQTLDGTLFLQAGFAESDMNVQIEVISLNPSDNSVVAIFTDEVTIAANTGSASYQVQGITGERFTVRYLCIDNTCGRFVREFYLTQNGASPFEFSNDAVLTNAQLPPVQNFTLPIGNTVSGTIFFPRVVTDRELRIFPVVQYIPNIGPSVVLNVFFPPEPIVIPPNTNQLSFTVEGVPPIVNERFFSFSFCENCEPDIGNTGLPEGVAFDEQGFIGSDVQLENSFPSNQNTTGIQLFHQEGEGRPSIISPIINLLLLNQG